jgi:hypothetical protein
MMEKGFDRHTTSTYLIALRGLEIIKNTKQLRKSVIDVFRGGR